MDQRTPKGDPDECGCSGLRDIPQSNVLAGLTLAQADVLFHDGAILDLAGAVKGKTRALPCDLGGHA